VATDFGMATMNWVTPAHCYWHRCDGHAQPNYDPPDRPGREFLATPPDRSVTAVTFTAAE
jgi:hypothetical protein